MDADFFFVTGHLPRSLVQASIRFRSLPENLMPNAQSAGKVGQRDTNLVYGPCRPSLGPVPHAREVHSVIVASESLGFAVLHYMNLRFLHTSLKTAPSGMTSNSTYFQRATRSFLANATMPIFRHRLFVRPASLASDGSKRL